MIRECLNQFIKTFQLLKNKTYLFCMLCIICGCLNTIVCMWIPDNNLQALVLSLQYVGSRGLNSGHKVWWHLPLPAEQSHLPLFKLFLSVYFSGIKYIHNLM